MITLVVLDHLKLLIGKLKFANLSAQWFPFRKYVRYDEIFEAIYSMVLRLLPQRCLHKSNGL